MKDFKSLKKLALYSAATVICVAGQSAFAHTGIRDKVTEGVSGYNAFTIGHGCNSNADENAPHQNVIAMSAVFPNSPDPLKAKIYKLTSTGIQADELPDLSDHIVGVSSGVGFTKLGLGLVAGGGTLFANFIPTVDGTGAIRGYHTWAGTSPYNSAPLQESVISTTGLSPFKYGSIQFKPTSCAKSLKVRVAVANWCKRGPANASAPDRVDLWMGHLPAGGVFTDQRTMPRALPYDAATEAPFWPTMTVYRNTTGTPATATTAAVAANPVPETDANNNPCNGGFDLAIEPADADINQYLPIPNGPFPQGAPGLAYPN